MRGTWDTTEPLVLQPGQQEQHQQQQKTIVEEQRHPLHSSTTPAWGIADRIVKEEQIEDRNNDSGVSPGHYTSNSASPRSRRSSSTANGSPSPGSATSQDFSTMQCSTFEYSPQRIYRPCDSPVEFSRLSGTDETSSHQPDHVSSSRKSSGEDIDNQDMLPCPICVFTTTDRLQFTEHLAAHCKSKSDDSSPDFSKSVPNQQSEDSGNRSSPARSDPSEHRSDEADEPGVRVPRINSQGKVKTFRCKQCNFVAITKLQFWEHSRIHIKAEKLLTCLECPFVTEYKHHLEYHLRNHAGSKPFKCDQCPYSCVNKSMLNSHLKSHSNVYQYRCANCSYATKYCHSLKLHLRKYSHKPAMVLNADGSPNPHPIIDVYGTRRGPKQKPVAKSDEQSHQIMARQAFQHRMAASPSQQVAPAQVSPVSHLVVNPVSNPIAMINPVQSSMIAAFPYNQFFGGFPLPGHFMVTDDTNERQMEYLKNTVMMECAKAMNAGCENVPEQFPQAMPNLNAIGGANNVNGMKGANEIGAARDTAATSTTSEYENMEMETDTNDKDKVTPLDLSKPENTPASSIGQVANSPRTAGTSRRKGRAVKLERRVLETELEEDVEEVEDVSKLQAASSTDGGSGDAKETAVKKFSGVGMSDEFSCQYCDMAFRDIAMYTIHMGYHDYKDPYTCNMCGHKCTDKLSFFIHMMQSKHS